MKPIDGDRLLSELYENLVNSEDVGDVVVRYKDVITKVRILDELPLSYESAEPARRYRDYNGYLYCNRCNSKVSSSSKYCSNCGKKFIDRF